MKDSERSRNGSFWTSLSGMLTALAAVITAGVGLWAALHHQPRPQPLPKPDPIGQFRV